MKQTWQEAKGKGHTMLHRIVLTGMLMGALVTSLPSTTFALEKGEDRRDDAVKHSLVQHPYSVRSVPGTLQAEIDVLKTQISQMTVTISQMTGTNTSLQTAL